MLYSHKCFLPYFILPNINSARLTFLNVIYIFEWYIFPHPFLCSFDLGDYLFNLGVPYKQNVPKIFILVIPCDKNLPGKISPVVFIMVTTMIFLQSYFVVSVYPMFFLDSVPTYLPFDNYCLPVLFFIGVYLINKQFYDSFS